MTARPLHVLVAEVAARQPGAPAVSDGRQALTYGQLDVRAEGLAKAISAAGISRGAVVGVLLHRGVDHIAAMLAVTKAGGCYLPLHPGLPRERVRALAADSGCECVVGVRDPGVGTAFVPIDRVGPADEVLPVVDAAENAYVIYTSGSTGRPKGVVVPHASVVALVADPGLYPLGPGDRAAQVVTASFDAAVLEIWCALLGGAALVVFDDDVRSSPDRLLAAFAAERITASMLPTPLFNELAARPVPPGLRLRRIAFGGDAASPRAVAAAFESGLADVVVNVYGPTECTVVTTYLAMERMPSAVTLGSPRDGCVVRVLDRHGEVVPIGVRGEIHVSGTSLAAGYLGQPGLTADRFVPDPAGPAGSRAYRTGDIAWWRPDGTLEFAGRTDDQVKINGHRVELEEVRAAVERHPDVEQAEVVVQRDGETRRLIAHVVTRTAVEESDLREFVAAVLPHYLTPSGFVRLGRMPVNANGKVDRRALPHWRPATTGSAGDADPATARLAAIWSEVLGLPRVGALDNFFALGGDSMMAMAVARRAADAGLRIDAGQVLKSRTLADLAAGVRDAVREELVPEEQGEAPLIPVQQWALERGLEFVAHELFIATEPLDLVLLEKALAAVVERHQALRVRFTHGRDGWRQVPGPPAGGIVLGPRPRAFDVEHGPLWRLEVSPDRRRVLYESIHLVTDAVSLAVFMGDLEEAYRAVQRGGTPRFAPAPSSLAWARALSGLARSGVLRAQLPWWTDVLASATTTLPRDFDVEPSGEPEGWSPREISLGDLTPALVQPVLLGALAVAFREWSGESRTLIDLQHHGRVARPDLPSSLDGIGWYVILAPVVVHGCDLTELADPGRAARLVDEVSLHLASRPDEGLGYGVLRYLDPDPAVREALSRDAGIRLNYRGKRSALSREGLFRTAPYEADVQDELLRSHDLKIVAELGDSTLAIGVSYSRSQYRDTSVEVLTKAFEEAFAVLAHAATLASAQERGTR
ncbi:amino acid adenylation domain-containing protein [Lentzea sp. NPDC059081]|uniref:amino acid adenylation domain-containing protein n=1 Tax=Lentzea sp. NPDC059081 TaxID=3346719 RepID=UPI0036C4D2AD